MLKGISGGRDRERIVVILTRQIEQRVESIINKKQSSLSPPLSLPIVSLPLDSLSPSLTIVSLSLPLVSLSPSLPIVFLSQIGRASCRERV